MNIQTTPRTTQTAALLQGSDPVFLLMGQTPELLLAEHRGQSLEQHNRVWPLAT